MANLVQTYTSNSFFYQAHPLELEVTKLEYFKIFTETEMYYCTFSYLVSASLLHF